MVTASFVMSAYMVKDEKTRRQVNFRQTKLRYFVVVAACLVVFGCEYIFDNPSVPSDPISGSAGINIIQPEWQARQADRLGGV